MTLARCAYEDQDIFANAWTLPIVPSQEWDDAEEGLAVKAAEAVYEDAIVQEARDAVR